MSGHEFAPLESIEDGTMVFHLNERNSVPNWDGYTLSNIYAYIPNKGSVARSHEVIHSFQNSRFSWSDDLFPRIWGFRYGSELVNCAFALQSNIDQDSYDYSPLEVEAYMLEKTR